MINDLLSAIRESATPRIWSKGVELSRQKGAINLDNWNDTAEISLRVRSLTNAVAHVVTLQPEDEYWGCDCASKDDPCEHVVGSILAIKHNGWQQGQKSGQSATLSYHFELLGENLSLQRFVKTEGQSERHVNAKLTVYEKTENLLTTQLDRDIDDLLAGRDLKDLKWEQLRKLFLCLSEAAEVYYAGHKVAVSRESTNWVVTVKDENPGVSLKLDLEEKFDQVFRIGIAVASHTVSTIAPLSPEIRSLFKKDEIRVFPQAFSSLVQEIIPTLKSHHIQVVVQTDKLPTLVTLKPKIALNAFLDGDEMKVSFCLRYGEDAFVRANRLVTQRSDFVPHRSYDDESRLKSKLQRDMGFDFDIEFVMSPPEFADWLTNVRKDSDFYVPSQILRRYNVVPLNEPEMRFQNGQLEIDFGSTKDLAPKHSAQFAERVLSAFQQNQSMIPLGENGFGRLPFEWLRKNQDVLDEILQLKAHCGNRFEASHQIRLAGLMQHLNVDATSEPELRALFDKVNKPIDDRVVPSSFVGTLRPYQEQGFKWLAHRKEAHLGALLADDMGLGKTIQALTIMTSGTLVICPSSVISNWNNELAKHRPELKVNIYHGPNRRLDAKADVVITTYGTYRIDNAPLSEREWAVAVIDEAQVIKNPKSQTSRAIFSLNAKFRLALTGTPVENSLSDAWSIFQFVMPGLLLSESDFRQRYESPILSGDIYRREKLRAILNPFILRRRKNEVLTELPPKTEETLSVDLSTDEQAQYASVFQAVKPKIAQLLKAQGINFEILEALLRLRQSCCHVGLLPGKTAPSSSKIDLLLEKLLEAKAEGHKALVFSQWTSFLDLIEPHLQERGISFIRLDGASKNRGEITEKFNASPEITVLLMSLKAGGVGLNLTSADHVFLMEPWWNPAVEQQAADRIYRIGQTRPVNIYKLIAKDTIEERIVALQEKKKGLSDDLLELNAAQALSTAEIMELFDHG
ncbi:MAG: DEAD/DEAH box helicase [Oligoflexales bacterium]